jgi:hypothetical protein
MGSGCRGRHERLTPITPAYLSVVIDFTQGGAAISPDPFDLRKWKGDDRSSTIPLYAANVIAACGLRGPAVPENLANPNRWRQIVQQMEVQVRRHLRGVPVITLLPPRQTVPQGGGLRTDWETMFAIGALGTGIVKGALGGIGKAAKAPPGPAKLPIRLPPIPTKAPVPVHVPAPAPVPVPGP